jgi:glycyl-tRNA synthetase (class II)
MTRFEEIKKMINLKEEDPDGYYNIVFLCLDRFPQFQKDFKILWQNKIITTEGNNLKWNRSLTSLGEYFFIRVLDAGDKYFWSIIEPSFGLERNTLTHLVNINGRVYVREVSRDYEEIDALLKIQYKRSAV